MQIKKENLYLFSAFLGPLRVLIRPDNPQRFQSVQREKCGATLTPRVRGCRPFREHFGWKLMDISVFKRLFWFGFNLTQIIQGYIVLEKHLNLTIKANVPYHYLEA